LGFCPTSQWPFAPLVSAEEPAPEVHQVPPLSPQDELKTIQFPDGYRLELVLSEPVMV